MDDNYVGVIEQTPEEKAKNWAFAEVVGLANANPVNWVEKKQPKGLQYFLNPKTWRRFDVRNQDGSGSCVKQTLAKLAGILAYIRFGVFIVFSAIGYSKRQNRPQAGMLHVDAYKIGQQGFTLESIAPSQNMNDAQMDSFIENDMHKELSMKFKNYIVLPEKNIDLVASVIETTKKGLMTWFLFGKGEWTDVPKTLTNITPNHHSVASVDYTLYDGEKALVVDESWGDTFGMNGQRVIKESFFNARNTHVSYPVDFKFETETVPVPQPHTFTKTLVYIPIHPQTQEVLPEFVEIHEAQKEDVRIMQDILKKDGSMPSNTNSTGLFQNITAKSLLKYQLKHQIASVELLTKLDGKSAGPRTLAKLNAR